MRKKFKRFGPFSYFWGDNRLFVTAWLAGHDNAKWGWEWGNDGYYQCKASICLRLGGLTLLSFERFSKGGFVVFVLGFWWIV